ncbi:MAG: hypothetical protein J6562_02180, partial [Candidatus Schmidhempelia sp.]|nr:hypothetical protein [Candidatus Schmidhempelia sp.]
VDYDYKIKDIPNWVISPNLLEVYPQTVVTNEDKIYKHEIYLIKRQDGLYDVGRIDEIMMRPRSK